MAASADEVVALAGMTGIAVINAATIAVPVRSPRPHLRNIVMASLSVLRRIWSPFSTLAD